MVVVVVVRLDVMPGGVVGAGAVVEVLLVVCARTGHAISAVAAIMVPIEACLAMVKYLPLKTATERLPHRGVRSISHKTTCGGDRWWLRGSLPSVVILTVIVSIAKANPLALTHQCMREIASLRSQWQWKDGQPTPELER